MSANGGTEPQWSHSGHELFCRDASGSFEVENWFEELKQRTAAKK